MVQTTTAAQPYAPRDRRDRTLVPLVAAAIALSTLLPYLIHQTQPVPGRVYSGLERYINDHLCYLMWINQVRNGSLSVANLYVQDATDRFPPSPIWAILGLMGRTTALSTPALYHIARVLLSFAYLLVLFRLAGCFCHDRLTQWAAWLLAAVGGGMGWLYWLITGKQDLGALAVSADYMPETWSYPSILHFPHFAASLLLMAGCVHLLCGAWQPGRALRGLLAGLFLGLLVVTHTYTAVTLLAVILLHAVLWLALRRRPGPVLSPGIVAALASTPFFLLQLWQTRAYDTLRRWAEANAMYSPAPHSYLLGFGLVGIAALWGMGCRFGLGRRKPAAPMTPADCFLGAWVIATVALLYSSLGFERRCVEGLHVALAMLAAPVMVQLARWLAARASTAALRSAVTGGAAGAAAVPPTRAALYVGLFIVLCMPGSVWYLLRELPSRAGYVDAGILGAEEAVYQRFGNTAKVFCEGYVGQWLPLRGRVRVYLGHHLLSFDHRRRAQVVRSFFSPNVSPPHRVAVFKTTGCNAVLAYGGAVNVLRAEGDYWEELFGAGEAALFVLRE